MRGMTKKLPRTLAFRIPFHHSINMYSFKHPQHLHPKTTSIIDFHIPMVSYHPRNRLLLPANVFDGPQILRKPKHFHLGFFRGISGVEELMICVMFHWCSHKNGLKTTCFLGMAREFWESFPQCPFIFSRWMSPISPSKTEMKNHGT